MLGHEPGATRLRKRIAIVDDDASVRKALSRLIEAHSFQSQPYASARDFIETLPFGSPDCLLLDLQMPGMTGIELLNFLIEGAYDIPTVIITANDNPDGRRQCEVAGVVDYLLKPVTEKTLLTAVEAALRR